MALQWLLGRMSTTLLLLVCVVNMGNHTTAAAVPNCTRRCGAVEFSFPFGLQNDDDPRCFYSDAVTFSLRCDTSVYPPKLLWGNIEIIEVNIETAKMMVLTYMSYDCYNASGSSDKKASYAYMAYGSFSFSYTDNIYVAVGCDTLATIVGLTSSLLVGSIPSTNYTGGCLSSCDSLQNVRQGDCSGIGCCPTSIPKGLRGYTARLGSFHNHSATLNFNPCSYSFLVNKNNYTFDTSHLTEMPKNRTFPTMLDWYVGNKSCELAMKNSTDYACISENSVCINSTNGPGYICGCSPGYQGNPYILDGCQDIDECQNSINCPSYAKCTNTPGSYNCTCPSETVGDPKTYGCITVKDKKTSVLAAVGISCALGTLILVAGTMLMRKRVTKKKLQKRRQKFYKNNHDILLKQLLLCHHSENIANRIKFFSLIDLEKATNKFDILRIIGDGGHGMVYKGILPDLQVVAIKKSMVEIEIEKEQFINEVILLSQISHRNVVKIVGCCLESEVPILVYEFISNGTLATHLHARSRENPLSWDDRLRIATEISSALAYMHTKANISIYHRDIKSSNILLDDRLTVKISDFRASRTILFDQTHISTNIQGTFGYLDPEYFHTGRLTEKSDVYGLGVILVELITGKIPTSKKRPGDERNVIGYFIGEVGKDNFSEEVDVFILEERNMEELELVVKLAKSCLSMRGIDRPTMKEVELTLEELTKGKKKKKMEVNMIKHINDKTMLHQAFANMDTSILSIGSTSLTASLDGQLSQCKSLAR